MKFYVKTIEQLHNSNGDLVEYATKSDPKTQKSAMSDYYDKCSAINKDLSDNGHTFAVIKVENSEGGVIKKEIIGAYVDTATE